MSEKRNKRLVRECARRIRHNWRYVASLQKEIDKLYATYDERIDACTEALLDQPQNYELARLNRFEAQELIPRIQRGDRLVTEAVERNYKYERIQKRIERWLP